MKIEGPGTAFKVTCRTDAVRFPFCAWAAADPQDFRFGGKRQPASVAARVEEHKVLQREAGRFIQQRLSSRGGKLRGRERGHDRPKIVKCPLSVATTDDQALAKLEPAVGGDP